MLIPVILSGGSGSRLWPLSRQEYPKHLIDLIGDHSLIQQTLLRLKDLDAQAPVLVCNHLHRFLVAEELRDIEQDNAKIVLEPCARNTAPAIAIAAMMLKPDDLMLVLPADHLIKNEGAFTQAVNTATELAESGNLVTFGISPDSPHTGYGYIERGDSVGSGFKVKRFVEKPDQATAEGYLAQGGFDWNAGMFLFKAGVFLSEYEQFEPESFQACQAAVSKQTEDLDFIRLDEAAFSGAADISVDYAVMERTDKAVVVPMDAGWSDVGSWDALHAVSETDENGNVLIGDVLIENVKNSYIRSQHHLVAAVGLENHLIIDTPDAVLVSPMSESQSVKKIVEQLKAANRQEPLHHLRQYQPWGDHELLLDSAGFQVRKVNVKPGKAPAFKIHTARSKHWVILQGEACAEVGDEKMILKKDESYFVRPGLKHRINNVGDDPLLFVEVQVGENLSSDDDMTRFEE